jgi:branched-chain amino acid transport system substrate-binding protein
MTRISVLRALMVATAATLAFAKAAPATAQTDATEFHVGIVASVTGAFASPTKDTFDGFYAWEKTRGLPGKKIVLTILDDETNPVNSANAFRKLAGDAQIQLIIQNTNSSSALAAKSFASEYKVPIISGGGLDALGIPPNPWLFKVAPSSTDSLRALAVYIQKKGYKRIAHIYGTDAYGQNEHDIIDHFASEYGYEMVARESFATDDTNFTAQWAKIRAANPDLIYSSASGRAAILSFKTYKQFGITTPLAVSAAGVGAAFFQAIGGANEADGMLSPTQRGTFAVTTGPSAQYYAALQKELGHTPIYFNVFGYDIGLIMEAAVANSDGTHQGLRDALEKLKDLPCINGPVTYTPENHTGNDYRAVAMGVLHGGVMVPVE